LSYKPEIVNIQKDWRQG